MLLRDVRNNNNFNISKSKRFRCYQDINIYQSASSVLKKRIIENYCSILMKVGKSDNAYLAKIIDAAKDVTYKGKMF